MCVIVVLVCTIINSGRSLLTDDRVVYQSVSVPVTRGYSVQPLPNHFGFILSLLPD